MGDDRLAAMKDAVRALVSALERIDLHAQRALLTDHVHWWVQRSTAHEGFERPLVGPDAVLTLVGSTADYFSDFRWDIQRMVAEGDLVAVQATVYGTRNDGRPYENDYHFLFRLEGDCIAEVWESMDSALAAPPPGGWARDTLGGRPAGHAG